MTKEELISKQQIQIEEYKTLLQENSEIKQQLLNRFRAIGQPLNDNVLKMNKDQIRWCFKVEDLVTQINCLSPKP